MITPKEKRLVATQEAIRCEFKAQLVDKPFSDDFIQVAQVLREIALDYSDIQENTEHE